jgi:membrane associated rhomboid family serine protease
MAAAMRCYRHPDRETYISCSECGRPICTECMTPAPVGQRCPEHSGKAQGVSRMTTGIRRAATTGTTGTVTRVLIGINVLLYLAELLQGAGVNAASGSIYAGGVLVASARDFQGHVLPASLGVGNLIGVAHGDWWRLITAAFLHYGPIHLGLNMLALYWFGTPVERYLGRWRYVLLYLVSGLAGSAGALLLTPTSPTVGASGAIFGILGAAFVLERQGAYVLGGSALGLIAINLVFSLSFRGNISVGGHIGGLIGGALCMLAFSRFGRGHAAYGRLGLTGIAGVAAVAVASVVIAYWKARGYA